MGKGSTSTKGKKIVDDGRKYPLSNDIIFEYVMRDPGIAKEVVEAALGIEIDHVTVHETQRVISDSGEGKGIRLDVYLEDGETCYDVEMQTSMSSKLGLRLRAYQSIIDSSALDRGGDFGKLKRSYLLFFFTSDPFNDNKPVYTFSPLCHECPKAELDVRMRWVLLNAKGFVSAPSAPLRSLLEYLDKGECPESGETELTCKLAEAVNAANTKTDVRKRIMISMEKKRELEAEHKAEQRFAEGKAEGEAKGEDRMAKLVSLLLADGRSVELAKAANNMESRKQLLAEYDLVERSPRSEE